MKDTRDDLFRQAPEPLEKTGIKLSGGSVLLCALAAVCVTALCLLAAARSGASMRLSQAAADVSAGYYAACLEANRDIASARENGDIAGIDRYYDISDRQALHVSVMFQPDGRYDILEWQSVVNGAWEPDTGLDVAQ